jgi:endonuclease YncB( thermonuclease family)
MDRSIRHGIACESNPCPCNYNMGGGSGGGDGDGGNSTPIKKQAARIIKVIDGDTVRVKLKGGPKRDVRLLGIDTPEVYGGVERGGKAASKKLKKQLPRQHQGQAHLRPHTAPRRQVQAAPALRHEGKGRHTGKAQVRKGIPLRAPSRRLGHCNSARRRPTV